jgi:FkbM family methyltransferase
MRRFFDPRRPFFLGEMSDGVRFVGDLRDYYSVLCAVDPENDGTFCRALVDRVAGGPGTVVDAGANVGRISVAIARARPEATVVAFEPEPSTARRAAATIALNRATNVRLFQAAVADRDGEIGFFSAGEDSLSASAYKVNERSSWTREVNVPCHTLDSLAKARIIDRVVLLKLDVEGAELAAVRGAAELIARDRPTVVFEYHAEIAPKVGWSAEEVTAEFARAKGYRFKVLEHDGRVTQFPRPIGESVNVLCEPTGHVCVDTDESFVVCR